MEFHPRNQVFTGHELTELVAISPDDAALRTGFRLQDPEVDDVVRAANNLEAGCIEPDTELTAEENVELLLRATRLLQLGLEVQFTREEDLVDDNNTLRNDLRALEDRNRALDDEVGELRELKDQDGVSGDVRELEVELKELRHEFEEERKANDRFIEQSDKDKQTIDSLEAKLQRGDELLKSKDDEVLDLREQLNRLRDDFDELRGQYAAVTVSGNSKEQHREMTETIRQQEWKIERLTKDNRALEASNCEIRAQLETIKEENLQVSEKILLLDSETREMRLAAAQADDKVEVLNREKAQLATQADELRADVAAKMALLDEFEDRFNRQYRSWEEERSSLTAQIEALRKEARLYVSTKAKGKGAAEGGAAGAITGRVDSDEEDDALTSPEAQLAAMKRALDEARENEVLLLEAYEQLENDVGKEIDRALSKQAEELSRLNRRVQFLESHLEAERNQVALLTDETAKLEGQLADATHRNAVYESGVYGLPQAAMEIRQLKATVAGGESRIKELVQQVNRLSAALEDLSDEATMLRRQAGLPDKPLDVSGVKMQKEITIAQLRSVNALLERQVSDLEEERRKLRLEVKFRAKYHGKAALEMGLSPEQLLLLEEYVEGLKGGRHLEERLVTQLQQRIEFLEVRLAEVMAYADIPITMRPALTELHNTAMQPGIPLGFTLPSVMPSASAAGTRMPALEMDVPDGDFVRGAAGVAVGIKATQIELVRGALLSCLKMLRQMSEALAENRQVSDTEYRQFTDSIINKLIDAERVTTLIIKDIAVAPTTTSSSGATSGNAAALAAAAAAAAEQAELMNAQYRRQQWLAVAEQENFVADAAAEELRDRLRQLARQVVDLQVLMAQKDAQLAQLAQTKAALEARLGLSGTGKDAAAVAAAAVAAKRAGDYVSREQHEEVELELSAVKEQLLESLEELSAREKELSELSSSCLRYQTSMAELAGQVKMLYKDYANNAANWKLERSIAEKQLKKAQAEAADATSQLQVLDHAVKTLESGDQDAIKHQYIDAVRRMAVTQLKYAKISRQLELSTSGEKVANEQLEELQEELQDVSSTCRSRIRWLEQAAADAARRTQLLYRCLQGTAPLEAYQSLVDKHSQMAREHRHLLEQVGDATTSSQVEELLSARKQLAELLPRYDHACDAVAELREKLRQLELPTKLASKPINTFLGSISSSNGSRPGTPSQTGRLTAAASDEVQMALNQDLVAAMVKLDGMNRRLEMVEREKERINASTLDAQAHAGELEQRLAQATAELATSRTLEGRLQQRLAASVPAAQLQEMAERLDAAEAAAKHETGAVTALTLRAEEAERKLSELSDRRQRQLANITNLRVTVRELSSTSDVSAQLGKMHTELDHARAKESLARSALNRSELERLELERQTRALKQQVASLTVQINVAQDHARWAESELLDSLTRLELGLSGHVETWKAARWAAKLEQLKARNDSLAEGLASSIRRLAKVEDSAQEAQLRTEMMEDIQVLLSRGVSDAHREAAALKEQQLVLKLEAGKLSRAELLMRQKVNYLERVNAELSELLEKSDVEALNQQGGLQAEKRQLANRVRSLQEEVVRLQDHNSAMLAENEEIKTARTKRPLLDKAENKGQPLVDPAMAAAKAAAAYSVADQELLLKQIDSLKEARTEAEHMRQECHRLQDELLHKEAQLEDVQFSYDDVLERLKSQSAALVQALGGNGTLGGSADETALDQLRNVAEAAIRELQGKVQDREKQIADLKAKLQEHQQAYLAQHAKDRAEIETLNNKLFESGAASIAGMKANLQRATAVLATTGDGNEEVPYEQLRMLLEERTSECEVLRNRLEQREASLEVMRRYHESQAQKQDSEVQRLTAALAAAPKVDPNAPNTKVALQKLSAEVRVKDERLRQLRGAIKALEGKLAQLLKDKTDLVMQASSWVEQEQLDEKLAELEAQKAELAAQLHATHADLSAARSSAAAQEVTMRKLSEQLLKEGEAVVLLRAQLAKEQALVKTLKAKTSKAMANLPKGSQQQLQLQVVQLQQRITDLLAEQQQLQAELSRLAVVDKALQGQANNISASYEPQKSVKAVRIGKSLNESMSLPGTPGADTPGAAAARRAHLSSGGGGHSSTGALTGGSGARAGSRLNTAGNIKTSGLKPADASATSAADGEEFVQQHQEQQAIREPSTSGIKATAGASYAPQQWEENKQLQAKMERLRKKLQKKSEDLESLQKECDRRNTLISALTAEKDKAASALSATQAKLKRFMQEAAPATAAPPTYRADAAKLKEYVEKVLQLEAEKDALMLQLETLRHQLQQHTPSAANSSDAALVQEQELFELKLQREQAVAAAARLRQQLHDLFGPEAAEDMVDSSSLDTATAAAVAADSSRGADDTGPGPGAANGKLGASDAAAAGGGGRGRARSRSSTGSAAGKSSGREAELLTTIANLKAALERVMSCSTPNTKYMQEVQQRKTAQKESARWQSELEKVEPQLTAANTTIAELQAANADMRVQLAACKQQMTPSESAAVVGQLQQLLAQKNAEVAGLKRALQDMQQRLAVAELHQGGSTASLGLSTDVGLQLAVLKDKVAAIERENNDLKSELNAFDPAFFEEIEDLKHDHYQLQQTCSSQAGLIDQLRAQLGQNAAVGPGRPVL